MNEIKNSTENLSPFIPSGTENLDRLLKFTIEADKMTHIQRRTLLTDGTRRENDAEHSWHIALMCMIFSEYAKDFKPYNNIKVALIDGEKLCEYMIEHNLGVTTQETYEVKRLDRDFFPNEE